ncbi:MAG: AAA family ATPase, partial [Nanoarchaeota archaeon]|nr:AAA family ATPase [Nanoarchaeota archaeon]
MAQKGLSGFFEKFIAKENFFLNKSVLQSNYMPETINHREEQLNQIAKILAPSLKFDKPSNLFIYGKTGTGKTLTTKHVMNELSNVAEKNNLSIKFVYVNCKLKKSADTEYRLVAQLAREFGKAIPPTGLPTDEVYKIFFDVVDREKQIVILILDEIDQLVKKTGDEILYNLTRINSELKNSQISIIGISNDLLFTDYLDPRVKSSLSEEEILFPPYDALQIQDILRQRANLAFKQGLLDTGVIEKCAAYAAREHGDSRRALELLRVAGELAERNNKEKISVGCIDEAEEKIERDRLEDIIKTQPKQFQTVLYAIFSANSNIKKNIHTGEVYEIYKVVCLKTGLRPLTQRRVTDILAELDMLG